MEKTFSTQEVANAARVTPEKLALWIARGKVPTNRDLDTVGTGGGRSRKFSFETAAMIAVAAHMIKQGMPVDRAFGIGVQACHIGRNGRLPARPFFDANAPNPCGFTMLFATGDETRIFSTVRELADYSEFTIENGAYILPYHRLFRRICRDLELDPREVMAASYGVTE